MVKVPKKFHRSFVEVPRSSMQVPCKFKLKVEAQAVAANNNLKRYSDSEFAAEAD